MARIPRVFFDTKVIFSGLYASGGPPAWLLDGCVEGRAVMLVSRQVLRELVRTVEVKVPAALPALHTLLSNTGVEVVDDPTPEATARLAQGASPDDAPILAAARMCGADYLVTGNVRHFARAQEVEGSSLIVVTPAQLMRLLGWSRG